MGFIIALSPCKYTVILTVQVGYLSVEWSKAFASSCGQQALTPHLGDRCLQTSGTNYHLSGDPWFVTLDQLPSGSLPWWWIYPASASLLMLLPGNPLLGVHSYILLPASSTGDLLSWSSDNQSPWLFLENSVSSYSE